MANDIPLKKRKQLAESYYFNFYTQKEISDILDTPENTIGRWVRDGDWKKIRDMKSITRDKLVSNLLSQVAQIEEVARNEKRPMNTKEADSIMKLSSSVEKLDKKINLSLIIQVFKDFNEFLLREDFELAKKFVQHQNNFIKNRVDS